MISNSRVYVVDSHNRLSGTHSNFTYKLDYTQYDNFTHCVVLQASIPKTYYLIDTNQNTFTLTELGVNRTITIPIGNYSVTSFRSVVSALLTASSPNGWVYTITLPNSAISSQTGKLTYTVTNNNGNQPTFTFLNNNLHEQFGFDSKSSNVFTANSLTSTNVVKFQARDSVVIHSDLSNNGNNDILQEIFCSTSSDYSAIKYQCTTIDAYSRRMSSANGNIYHFSITDEDNNLLNLNGSNVVFSILLFRKESIFDIIRQITPVAEPKKEEKKINSENVKK